MQTILQILKMAGGWHPGLYFKIDNAPYMELVIEAMDESGPMGLPALSVAHYGKQNGDLLRRLFAIVVAVITVEMIVHGLHGKM
jgi:hypothetical protein